MLAKQDQMLGKQDQMLDMQKETLVSNREIKDSINDMNSNVDTKFDWLADRYGEFGKTMHRLEDDMHDMKITFKRLADHIIDGK